MTVVKIRLDEIETSDEMLELRPIDAFTVSRYRQAVRTGVKFPPLVLDSDGGYVVSGNHRLRAYLAELPDDTMIEVEPRMFDSNRERLEFMARENMSHGMPMDGITRRRVALSLADEGMPMNEIAALFNVPEKTLEKWGEHVVTVIGKGCGRNGKTKPIKAGPEIETGARVDVETYATHIKTDMGASVRHMAGQITRWIGNGWVNMEDERNIDALKGLRAAINGVMK